MEFVIVIFIVLFLFVGYFGHRQAVKRRQELSHWAETLGLVFCADKDRSFDDRFSEFSHLQQGSNRYAYNIIEGRYNKYSFSAFDYHYETHSTDSKGRRETHHHYFSAVVVDTGFPLKPLFIRNETIFDKVGEFFGFDDIDFELAEFSREFMVKSPDRRWAFDVLHQESMEFLLASPRFTLDMQNRRVLAYRSGTLSVAELEQGLDVVTGLIDRLPDSVVRELKEAH
ncbi:MAG: hypothetical protein O2955_12945 [Planctomycetota bacterium]|nr:hypothetical protein [Planctomycetota bacterium]